RASCSIAGATARGPALQRLAHGHGAVLLLDGLETVALVQPGVVGLGAEADRRLPFVARPLQQCLQQLAAQAAAAPSGNDGDRELRRLLVDEAEARLARREEAVPGGSDGPVLPRDQARVAGTAEVVDVAGNRQIGIHVQAPVVRVLEHVAKEPDVLRTGLTD